MKNRLALGFLAAGFAALCLWLAPPALAGEGDAEPPPASVQLVGDPGRYAETAPEEDRPGTRPAGTAAVTDQVMQMLNYQGYVTDNLGAPLNGPHTFTVRLHNSPTSIGASFGPETFTDVPVTNGLFHLTIGSTLPLYPSIFGQALWIGIEVDGTALPRQQLNPVPYAFGVVPGASIEGIPTGGAQQGLYVGIEGDGIDGIHARGNRYGLYVAEDGPGDVGIYSVDYINSLGYRSRSDSYVWAPGLSGVAQDPADLNIFVSEQVVGRVNLEHPDAVGGEEAFMIPLQIPAVSMGTPVDVEELTVYYNCSSAGSYITGTELWKVVDASSQVALINDTANRTSIAASSYSLTPAGDNVLSADSGPLTVVIRLSFSATDQFVRIAGVRLRLGHTASP